eukprot:scaffold192274_cov37-Tisochrysis_lutea.AAC.2
MEVERENSCSARSMRVGKGRRRSISCVPHLSTGPMMQKMRYVVYLQAGSTPICESGCTLGVERLRDWRARGRVAHMRARFSPPR